MRIVYVIEDLFRYHRRRLLAVVGAAAAAALLVFVASRALTPGTPTDPFGLAVAVCEGPGRTFDPDNPSPDTWTGSHDDSSAELRCNWPGVDAATVAEHLAALGYRSVDVGDGLVDYLGRDGAWVVNAEASGDLPGVSAAGLTGSDVIDVLIGGFIHVHDDGTQHRHDVHGNDATG